MCIKSKDEKFYSLEEFLDNVERGGEIEFIYNDKQYSIAYSEDGIHFMEAYNSKSEKIVDSSEQVGELNIGDEKLKDIILKAQIIFRCF